jgi:hypothetical protein
MGNEAGTLAQLGALCTTPGVSESTPCEENVNVQPYVPSDDAKKFYSEYIGEIRKRQISSSENFDKSILTYSSAGLALSLGFLKDFVPPSVATCQALLFSSWGLFTLATVLTIISFLISYSAQEKMLEKAERYYCQGDQSAMTEPNWLDIAITWINLFSGAAFVVAIIFTTVFVSINLDKANVMKKPNIAQDGMPSPTLAKVFNQNEYLNKGMNSPSMPKVPASSGQATQSPSANSQPASPAQSLTNPKSK